MGIEDEDIVRVREATDLADLISSHLQLKRVGRRSVGLCPFHNEKTPSFNVNAELGFYKCFGCGKSGDARVGVWSGREGNRRNSACGGLEPRRGVPFAVSGWPVYGWGEEEGEGGARA